jgi:hypothetical protein
VLALMNTLQIATMIEQIAKNRTITNIANRILKNLLVFVILTLSQLISYGSGTASERTLNFVFPLNRYSGSG